MDIGYLLELFPHHYLRDQSHVCNAEEVGVDDPSALGNCNDESDSFLSVRDSEIIGQVLFGINRDIFPSLYIFIMP